VFSLRDFFIIISGYAVPGLISYLQNVELKKRLAFHARRFLYAFAYISVSQN